MAVLHLAGEVVGDDRVGELVRVGPAVFVDRQAVQPVDPADFLAAEQATEKTGVKLRIVGDHQGRAVLHELGDLAGRLGRLHALGLKPLVGDAGQADDVLREGLALGQLDEGVHLAGDPQAAGGRALHAQGGELDDLVVVEVEAAGLGIKYDEGLVAVEQGGEVTHAGPPSRGWLSGCRA